LGWTDGMTYGYSKGFRLKTKELHAGGSYHNCISTGADSTFWKH